MVEFSYILLKSQDVEIEIQHFVRPLKEPCRKITLLFNHTTLVRVERRNIQPGRNQKRGPKLCPEVSHERFKVLIVRPGRRTYIHNLANEIY